MSKYTPDLVLLEIGTNDILSDIDLDNIGVRLETLVDTILSYMDEDDVIFLATIPYVEGSYSSWNDEIDKYNATIKSIACKKAADNQNVVFVDINSVVGEGQYVDGIYPNLEGYKNMGNLWYAVLTEYESDPEAYLANIKAEAKASAKKNVYGNIYVYDNDDSAEMTVVATAADGTIASVTAISMGEYVIENLEAGEYTLTISGGRYAPRSYEVTVSDDSIAQDVELNPYGDINGDGEATTADVGLANSHAKGVSELTDYEYACADVNINESITTADVGMINSHEQGIKPLW